MFSNSCSKDCKNKKSGFYWGNLQRILVLILAFSSCLRAAQDQDLFLTPLKNLKNLKVSSIDFSDRSLTDSFASAYVLTDDMIESLPMFYLSEYFEMLIPGAIIVPQGGNGAGLGVRGSGRGGGVRTLTLWDGHSLNRHNDGGNMSVYYSPLLGDLEQVEVVLGPGSVKHGTGALHGYINFVSKNGQDYEGSKASLDHGLDDDSIRFQVDRGQVYGQNRNLYVYGGYFQADGFQTTNDFGGSTSPSLSEGRRFSGRDEIVVRNHEPSYKFSLNWNHDRFNLKTLFEHLEFNPNGLVAGVDTLNQRTTFSLQPKYTFQLPHKSSFELSSSLGLFDKSLIHKSINESTTTETGGSDSSVELRGTLQSNYFDNHSLALGMQTKWLDARSESHYFSANPNRHRVYVDGSWKEFSLYFEDAYQGKKTSIIGGLRYDVAQFKQNIHFDGNDQSPEYFKPSDIFNASPRLAFTYKTDGDLLYRAVYQEGFSYPTISEYPLLFSLNDFLQSEGFESLENRSAEVLKDFELGVRGDLIKNVLQFDLTAYYNRYENRGRFVNFRINDSILPDAVKTSLPNNINGIVLGLENDVDAYGAELSLTWQPTDWFHGNLSYSYAVPDHVDLVENQFAELTNASLSEWSRFPKHQWKTNIRLKHKNWGFSIAGVYQSGLEIDNGFAPERENISDEYVRVNAGINYEINKKTSISMTVKNVFQNRTPSLNVNAERPWLGSLGSDERLIYLGLKINL